jgi:hypothetical protein
VRFSYLHPCIIPNTAGRREIFIPVMVDWEKRTKNQPAREWALPLGASDFII